MFKRYVLKNYQVIEVTPEEWAEWMADNSPVIAETMVDDLQVSTIFLGLDNRVFQFFGEPILFETKVLDLSKTNEVLKMGIGVHPVVLTQTYTTWENARLGHSEIVRQFQSTS